MAHKKAAGGGVRQHKNPTGKRLGVKKTMGESVVSGNILIRQKGTVIKPGKGTKLGKDFTIFALKSGKVVYRQMALGKGQKMVEVK